MASRPPEVFILANKIIYEARNYQEDAFKSFMLNAKNCRKQMKYSRSGIEFVLKRLKKNKDVVKMVTESGDTHYLSSDHALLKTLAEKIKKKSSQKTTKTKKTVDPTMKLIKSNFAKLYSLYDSGYSPDFCKKVLVEGIPNGNFMPQTLTPADFASSVVYFGPAFQWSKAVPKKSLREMAEQLAKEREPVNIAMNNQFYLKRGWSQRLHKNFGYKEAAYKHLGIGSIHGHASNFYPPNIMILAKTPAQGCGLQRINVINAIALALDDKKQRDWKQLPKSTAALKRFIQLSYNVLFERIYSVAIDNKFKTIVFVGMIGSAAFWAAVRRKLNIEYGTLIQPIFESVRSSKQRSIKTLVSQFLGVHSQDPRHFDVNTHLQSIANDDPNALDLKSGDLPSTVFVNAWDPFSIVGNGNCGDPSADGAFGCQTCMQVLTWPHTNPFIQYRPFPENPLVDKMLEQDIKQARRRRTSDAG